MKAGILLVGLAVTLIPLEATADEISCAPSGRDAAKTGIVFLHGKSTNAGSLRESFYAGRVTPSRGLSDFRPGHALET